MPDDEIDLLELLRLLLARKWLIVCLTLTGLVLATVYTFTRPVVFQSQAHISKLLAIDVSAFKGASVNSNVMYNLFFSKVNLAIIQDEVLSSQKLAGHRFSVNVKKGTIALQGDDPAKLAEPINLLLRKADDKIFNDIMRQRLVSFEDALVIAEKAGITDPVLTDSKAPLYFYGSKVLKAEIMSLNEVDSDVDAVTSPEKTELMTVILSQPALEPTQPVGQKSGLIIVLGAILGFMMAIFMVFALNIKDKFLNND